MTEIKLIKTYLCKEMIKIRWYETRFLISCFNAFIPVLWMCLFRTNPPQTTSNLGTALRPWSPSSLAAAVNTRTGWSYSVKPGTLPPPSRPTHPKETSRLKCEPTSSANWVKTKLSYIHCRWSWAGRALKESVLVYRCEDRSQKKLYSIFSHRDIKWTRGAGSVW